MQDRSSSEIKDGPNDSKRGWTYKNNKTGETVISPRIDSRYWSGDWECVDPKIILGTQSKLQPLANTVEPTRLKIKTAKTAAHHQNLES